MTTTSGSDMLHDFDIYLPRHSLHIPSIISPPMRSWDQISLIIFNDHSQLRVCSLGLLLQCSPLYTPEIITCLHFPHSLRVVRSKYGRWFC